jgi:hypothetical protein
MDLGHEITLLCDGQISEAFLPPGIPISRPCIVDQWEFFGSPVYNLDQPTSTRDPVVDWAAAAFPEALAAVRPLHPELLVSSLHCMHLAERLSQALKIPWVFINPSFYFGDDSLRPWEDDFASPRMIRAFRGRFLPVALRATAVLHATDPSFDPPPPSRPTNHHYVGPLIWERPDISNLSFLHDAGPPWVLITVSTSPQPDEIQLARTAVEALAERPVRVLLTLPPGQPREQLGELPPNVRLTGFVSHLPVLEKVVLAISQAGHGLVMKCLYQGVPMVLVPWDRDQPGVAARAEALGVARVVPRSECSKPRVAEAIASVLGDSRFGRSSAMHASRLQGNDAPGQACDRVMGLLGGRPS